MEIIIIAILIILIINYFRIAKKVKILSRKILTLEKFAVVTIRKENKKEIDDAFSDLHKFFERMTGVKEVDINKKIVKKEKNESKSKATRKSKHEN